LQNPLKPVDYGRQRRLIERETRLACRAGGRCAAER